MQIFLEDFFLSWAFYNFIRYHYKYLCERHEFYLKIDGFPTRRAILLSNMIFVPRHKMQNYSWYYQNIAIAKLEPYLYFISKRVILETINILW